MIQKLRLKFVAICMALVTTVLAAVFFSVYVTMERNVEDLSRQVLHRVAKESPRVSMGGLEQPEIGIDWGGDRVLLPYFTVEVWGSRAFVTGGTYAGLEDTDALRSILSACLKQPEREGSLDQHRLRYLRQDMGLYQQIAFVDMSVEMTVIRSMMGPYAAIGTAALLLLLGVSILLSFWAVRPVERAWKQQRQFLSDASHELKTPLTVILSNAELLEGAALEDRPARWVDNIHSESRRMKSLVEEMLTLARSNDLRRNVAQSRVCISDIAASCALAFEPVAFEAGKPLDYALEENLFVLGDHERLRQLMSILLDNAIKYGAAGSPIQMSLHGTERQVRLTVSNAGTPIPPKHLPHLFERFYRADASRGEQSGFGLGLSIAKAIAEEHKGVLRVESDVRSTRFFFVMNLKK